MLYISGCKGDHCCYVTDITLDGGTIVQKLFHTGEGYTGSFDWFIDRKNKIIYTYGSSGEMRKLIKKFRLPTLKDSDENGEVHLTQDDALDEFYVPGIKYTRAVFSMGITPTLETATRLTTDYCTLWT